MGQYRLWLQHREIDQLLRAQLKALVNELAQVDEHIRLLANSRVQIDNVIIQTLLKEFQLGTSSVPVPSAPVQAISSSAVDVTLIDTLDLQDQSQDQSSVSAALFTWGRLPKFASVDPQNQTRETALPQSVRSTSLSAENLLSPDIQRFVEAHNPTPSQTKITRKFADIVRSTRETMRNASTSPVDQQSIRVNQGVERWFERRTHILQGSGSNQEEQKESML